MIVVIEGPTASGKSSLAMALAQSLGSCIISADSRQVYKGMDIGTAKPSREDQARVKHHLIDIIEPNQRFSAGDFVKRASAIIAEEREAIPIVCGGTGLFIKSLLEGICELPPIDRSIKAGLREYLNEVKGNPESYRQRLDLLYAELSEVDPVFAAKVSRNDPQRIIRGLEVFRGTGIPLSTHWQNQNQERAYNSFRILINPPRASLYARINTRFEQMVAAGLLDEISGLLKRGYTFDDPGLNSLGYKEFRPYFEGKSSLEECVKLAAQRSRNYAKRQVTWYRNCEFDLTMDVVPFNISVIEAKIQEFVSAAH
jgi:tRNA dimethylallyltransferase